MINFIYRPTSALIATALLLSSPILQSARANDLTGALNVRNALFAKDAKPATYDYYSIGNFGDVPCAVTFDYTLNPLGSVKVMAMIDYLRNSAPNAKTERALYAFFGIPDEDVTFNATPQGFYSVSTLPAGLGKVEHSTLVANFKPGYSSDAFNLASVQVVAERANAVPPETKNFGCANLQPVVKLNSDQLYQMAQQAQRLFNSKFRKPHQRYAKGATDINDCKLKDGVTLECIFDIDPVIDGVDPFLDVIYDVRGGALSVRSIERKGD